MQVTAPTAPFFLFSRFPSSPAAKQPAIALPNDPQSLEHLQAWLLEGKTLKDWLPYQQAIADCIRQYSEDLVQLDHFLSALVQHAIKENAIDGLAFISSLLSFTKMDQMLQLRKKGYSGIEGSEGLVAKEASFYPKIEEKKREFFLYKECRRLLSSFLSLVNNLIDSVLEVLSLPNSSKFTSLFDQNQIWDMFFKLFAFIPYILIPLLRPFVSDKVYLVATLVLVAIGIFTFVYNRWIKPLPTIINSERLEEQIKKGKIHTVENTEAMQELIQSLAINKRVLLVGKSGEGKTALAHHLVKWKNQESFLTGSGQPRPSRELQQLEVARIDCGYTMGDVSYGYARPIEKLSNQVRRWHRKLLLFFDEFSQIVAKEGAFRMFKDRFLKCSIPIRFISAVTYEEFKELKKLDSDYSFRRCVHIIFIQAHSPDHLRLILAEERKRQPKHIHISNQAMEKIIELSNSEDYFKGVGRPAKVTSLLDEAAAMCMAAYQGHYSSEITRKIGKLREENEIKTDSYIYNDSSDAQERENLISSKQEMQRLQNQLKEEQGKEIEKIKSLFEVRENLKKKYHALTHLLAGASSLQQVDEETKTLYLLYHFYAREAMMEHIQKKMEQESLKEIPLQVNEKVVQQAFEMLKNKELQANA